MKFCMVFAVLCNLVACASNQVQATYSPRIETIQSTEKQIQIYRCIELANGVAFDILGCDL